MTAYLKPGDHVVLAIPVSPVHDTARAFAEGQRLVAALAETYKRHGVTIDDWTGHSGLHQPVVVAVFRAEEPADG